MNHAHRKPSRRDNIVTVAMSAVFFLCGATAWVFKMKGEGDDLESGLLPFSPLQVLLPLLGVCSVAIFLLNGRGSLPTPMLRVGPSYGFQIGVGLICLGAGLHLGSSDYGRQALFFIGRWLMPIMYFYFFLLARRSGVPWRPLLYGLVAGAVISVIAVELARAGLPLPVRRPTSGGGARFGGFLSHPNQYGILVSTTAPIIVFLFRSRNIFEKLTGICMVPLYLLALFQSLSKANIIFFFLSLAACSLLLAVGNPKKLVATFIGLAVLATGMVAGGAVGLEMMYRLSPRNAAYVEEAIFNTGDSRAMVSREEIWGDAIDHIRKNPLFGLGPGRTHDELLNNHAHNLFLQMWLDAGVAGELGVLLVVGSVFWRAGQIIRPALRRRGAPSEEEIMQRLSGVAIVTYVIANSVSDSFSTATMPVFVLFAGFAFCMKPEQRQPAPGPVEDEAKRAIPISPE